VCHSSQECGSRRDCRAAVTADRRSRGSSLVFGPSSQSVHSIHRKRSSATSCQSAPPTTAAVDQEQVPGIHIQHIEALPYHVAVVTTDCGGGGRLRRSRRSDARDSVTESDARRRYIIIHNELSSASSLSHSRSSKASSIVNMNDFSSLESDTDPTTVTMTTNSTGSAAAATSRRRRSSQRVR